MKRKIKIITLGCDKNLVDSETIAGQIVNNFDISPDYENGYGVIVNTCGFIGDAKKESVQAILEALELKKAGNFMKVFVTGCLSQRYHDELKQEFPEVDAIFRLKDISGIMRELEIMKEISPNIFTDRIALEYDHTAYVMISDGCDHKCSYCAIPGIRGKYISRPEKSILEEVNDLKSKNVKEIIIIGQEISSYGSDMYDRIRINELLEEISGICGDGMWIRIMYTHPPMVTESFIRTIAAHNNICNYIDFPIQHTETSVLADMKRGGSSEKIKKTVSMIRSVVPEISIRTSIIAGFPGETRKIFNSMLRNLSELKFDRLGAFPYSREEGTKAYNMSGRITEKTARKRVAEIMAVQQDISLENNLNLIGTAQKVLIDRIEGEYSIGRTFRDAQDIDCEVLVKEKLQTGEFYNIEITEADEFDLYGRNLAPTTLPL